MASEAIDVLAVIDRALYASSNVRFMTYKEDRALRQARSALAAEIAAHRATVKALAGLLEHAGYGRIVFDVPASEAARTAIDESNAALANIAEAR